MSSSSNAGCSCTLVCLDIKFSSVVLTQSTVLLCEEMSLSRPLHEALNDLSREVLGELGLPRLENKTCVGTVEDLPQGLSQASEYWGVLGPGLWRFVACIAEPSPLKQRSACHRQNPCAVWSWGTVHVPFRDASSFHALPHSGIPNHDQPFGATPWRGRCSVGHWGIVLQPEGCSPGPKCHCRDVDGQAGWEWVSHKTLLCLVMLLQEWEMHYLTSRALYQGLRCECLLAFSDCLVFFKIHVRASVSVSSRTGADLPPGRHDGCALPSRLERSSYRLCSIRVQISFALFSFWKNEGCFVYPCKCQKHKI